jgi:hypothetical protein
MTRLLAPIVVLRVVSAIASIAIVEGFTTTTTTTTTPNTMSNNNIANKAVVVEGARQSTELYFGIPTFGKNDDDDDDEEKQKDLEKPSVGLKGLIQLITAGAGAPFLGDYQGVDKETGNFMFSLEANNLVDEDGKSKQTSMPYFESGWVDPKDLEKEEQKKKKGGGFKLW